MYLSFYLSCILTKIISYKNTIYFLIYKMFFHFCQIYFSLYRSLFIHSKILLLSIKQVKAIIIIVSQVSVNFS